ncbi:MAG: hypothetical protein R3C09_19790 [Pirellulaceae bacterium]|jgi:hypothetical protein
MPGVLKNPYGLRQGVIVTAEMVERGLACGCTCPDCGEQLIANHGSGVKQPYFSHESGSECTAAYETALHILAKEVLAEKRRILLPPLDATVDQRLVVDAKQKVQLLKSRFVPVPIDVSDLAIPTKTIVRSGHYQKFDSVDTEVHLKEVIPDVVMHVGSRILLVEIYVTHAVTDAKRRWLEKNALPMVEFDFSAADRTIKKTDLTRAFQSRRPYGDGSAKWIHHPGARSERETMDSEFRSAYLDRINSLVEASDPANRATCMHEQTPVLGEDGVRRSMCCKCWKFFGRMPGR